MRQHAGNRRSIGAPGAVSIALAAVLLAVLGVSDEAIARGPRKTHVVKPGESVARIADFYGVSQRDLRELNGLGKHRPLKVGQEIEIPNVLRVPGKPYKVKPGDTLASIAAKFDCSVRQLANANKLEVGSSLEIGRTLVIPDKGATTKGIKVRGREIKPILFLRVRSGERERLKLYSAKGVLNKRSQMRLSYLARDKIGDKVKRLNFRLVKMIQTVAEEFPDQPIEIISGYRAQEVGGNESQHAFGRALDFRVPGVPTRQLFRCCRKLPRAGCGHYPKDGFVHMDAREESAYWID